MRRPLKLNTGLQPVSEFRADATDSAAVVLDVAEREPMVEKIELLSDVHTSIQQIEAGQAVSNRAAKAELRKRFSR